MYSSYLNFLSRFKMMNKICINDILEDYFKVFKHTVYACFSAYIFFQNPDAGSKTCTSDSSNGAKLLF